jgi:hypothetical protein
MSADRPTNEELLQIVADVLAGRRPESDPAKHGLTPGKTLEGRPGSSFSMRSRHSIQVTMLPPPDTSRPANLIRSTDARDAADNHDLLD